MPAAEVDIPLDLVRLLVATQHPDLALLPVEVMANGWDNLMCRLGDELVVRLPRRAMAASLVEHEQRWLPVLAPWLPLAVPAPVRVGHAGHGYPWAWSIVPYLPGQIAATTPPADPQEAAARMGRFLAALHVPAAPGAPPNPMRGIPLRDRAAADMRNLGMLDGAVNRGAVLEVWEAALAAPPWQGPGVWLHGDLHPANILVHQGRVSGVIDFGDITSGDPAADLSVAWMLLPLDAHRAFRDAYIAGSRPAAGRSAGASEASPSAAAPGVSLSPATEAALWARARGWALVLALVFQAYSADNPVLARIGQRTLDAALDQRQPG
jgi:aminoglycoside phosphotransferase (APT) family kinase protein